MTVGRWEVFTGRGRTIGPQGIANPKPNCKYGHPLSGVNLYSKDGRRYCKTCRMQRKRKYRAAAKKKITTESNREAAANTEEGGGDG